MLNTEIKVLNETKIKNLEDQLDESEKARMNLKIEISSLTDIKIKIEEELYECKTNLLDVLDEIKVLEEHNKVLEEHNV